MNNRIWLGTTMAMVLLCAQAPAAETTAVNLVPNGRFEQGLTGWGSNQFAELSLNTSVVHSTGASLRFDLKGPSGTFISSSSFPLAGGRRYEFSCWVALDHYKTEAEGSHIAVSPYFFDAQGKQIGLGLYLCPELKANKFWRRLGGCFTAPTNAATGQIWLTAHSGKGPDTRLEVRGYIGDINLQLTPEPQIGDNLIYGGGFEDAGAPGWQSNGMLDTEAHSGKYSMMLKSGSIEQGGIPVKPNAVYLMRAYIKTEGVSQRGGSGARIVVVSPRPGASGLVCKDVLGRSDWIEVSGIFTNDAEVKDVKIAMYVPPGIIAWFDDIYLGELPAGQKMTENKMRNSSFEFTRYNPDSPDDWYGMGVAQTPEWHNYWQLDRTQAVEGKNSLKITRPAGFKGKWTDLGAGQYFSQFQFGYPNYYPESNYFFSVYLKADRQDMKVMLALCDVDVPQEVQAGTEWRRVSLPFPRDEQARTNIIRSGGGKRRSLQVRIGPQTEGTLWIDAVQLEEGREGSAYAPSVYDRRVAASLGLLKTNVATASDNVPSIACAHTKIAPVLDGRLDDPCWQKAAVTTPFREYRKGGPVKWPTECRLLADAENLYVGVRAVNLMDNLKVPAVEHDGNVWSSEDVFELFLDPGRENNLYQLVVNPRGDQWDGLNCDPKSWNPDWTVKTSQDKDGWTAEMAIPLAGLGIHERTGDQWKINFCRWNMHAGEGSAWSPTYGGFINVSRLGLLTGMDDSVVGEYRWSSREWKLQRSQLPPATRWTLSLNLSHGGNKPAKVRIVSMGTNSFKPQAGEEVIVPAGKTVAVSLPDVPVVAITNTRSVYQKYQVGIEVRDADSGKKLYQSTTTVSALPILMTKLDRSFYTTETEARLISTFGIAPAYANTLSYTVAVKNSSETIFRQQLKVTEDVLVCPIPIAKWLTNNYTVTATLQQGGQTIATVDRLLKKLPPSKTEVKLDRVRQVILVNGQPFIPLAAADLDWQRKNMRDLAHSYGFNCFFGALNYDGKPEYDDQMRKALAELDADGFKLINWGTGFTPSYHGREGIAKYRPTFEQMIPKFKDCPALLAWKTIDEPNGWSDAFGGTRESLAALCDTARRADPYRPAFINYNHQIHPEFGSDASDICSIDHYCRHDGDIGTYTKIATELMEDSGGDRPGWMWVHLSVGDFPIVELGATQFSSTVYQCLIAGVRGILYFIGLPTSKNLADGVAALNREVQKLTPVLMEGTVQGMPGVAVFPASGEIQTLLKQHDGQWFLITVNRGSRELPVTFDLSGIGIRKSKAGVLFENRQLPISQSGSLTDTFKPYERHVYAIPVKSGWRWF